MAGKKPLYSAYFFLDMVFCRFIEKMKERKKEKLLQQIKESPFETRTDSRKHAVSSESQLEMI